MKTPIELFNFELPEGLIAQKPPYRRGTSRLLYIEREGESEDRRFNELPLLLDESRFLVINTTRVINARLLGQKTTGGKVEIFLIERVDETAFTALTNGKVKPGMDIMVGEAVLNIEEFLDEGGLRLIRFKSHTPEEVMEQWGHVPLPPYIKRKDTSKDRSWYQTVYAKSGESVAAPTAGLHFTDEIMDELRAKGVEVIEISLDVGIGTFRPVKDEHLEDHRMHSEKYHVSEEAAERINTLKAKGKKLVAVGTTAVRTIESAFDDEGIIHPGNGSTELFITPGYSFKGVDELITNFHLPKSTLLVLVSAFAGRERMLKEYEQAVEKEYRFFSYGDAMYIR
ncbi:tRNA preQ1(34) S-adenosylmethionine ribosyltransferase-isomerase QueA [Limisalsivibrio acetivorans]|uniref:tRNA preQ1(34) S-adenosylmethionine ribosyltransferase-isomerase QueA n=1 Tax=Limisalsivibrio acetivorans TaxID=1304888 RepID=UPI0003B72AE8|nr:tRNA preQ1(34) S-adenosylmethionine ribosyltransferase-isomerase QueA [Limisalsivibrio acetivorans]